MFSAIASVPSSTLRLLYRETHPSGGAALPKLSLSENSKAYVVGVFVHLTKLSHSLIYTQTVGNMSVGVLSLWVVALGAASMIADPACNPQDDACVQDSAAAKIEPSTQLSPQNTSRRYYYYW